MCGRAARWCDEQIKDRINARWEVYRKVVKARPNRSSVSRIRPGPYS